MGTICRISVVVRRALLRLDTKVNKPKVRTGCIETDPRPDVFPEENRNFGSNGKPEKADF